MSFGIDNRKLKKLIDLYHPNNHAQEMKYLLILKGEDDLFISTPTSTQTSKPAPSKASPSTPSKIAKTPLAPIKYYNTLALCSTPSPKR